MTKNLNNRYFYPEFLQNRAWACQPHKKLKKKNTLEQQEIRGEWFWLSGVTNEVTKNLATADRAWGRKLSLIETTAKQRMELLRGCFSPDGLPSMAGKKLLPHRALTQEAWQTDWARSNYWNRMWNQTLEGITACGKIAATFRTDVLRKSSVQKHRDGAKGSGVHQQRNWA